MISPVLVAENVRFYGDAVPKAARVTNLESILDKDYAMSLPKLLPGSRGNGHAMSAESPEDGVISIDLPSKPSTYLALPEAGTYPFLLGSEPLSAQGPGCLSALGSVLWSVVALLL